MTREEAKQIIITEYCKNRAFCELYLEDCKEDECEIYHALKALEAEPKHGRWIYDGKGGYGLYKCSECNEFWSHWYADVIPIERMNKILKFCPNCGAIMDEVTE